MGPHVVACNHSVSSIWNNILATETEQTTSREFQAPNSLKTATPSAIEPPLHPTASFLDLPGELRNQVYYADLFHYAKNDGRQRDARKELRLSLKLKTTESGRTYVKEVLPPLCRAVPLLLEEILSVYYSENRFRIKLMTPQQRATFLKWAEHRRPALKHCKELRLVFGVKWRASKEGRQAEEKLSSNLRICTNANGMLDVWHHYRKFLDCGLCSPKRYPYGKQWWFDPVFEGAEGGNETIGESNSPLDAALTFCRLLDAASSSGCFDEEAKRLGWNLKISSWNTCHLCRADISITVL